jgi:hypothetical protein
MTVQWMNASNPSGSSAEAIAPYPRSALKS